jgi:chaperonin GroEL
MAKQILFDRPAREAMKKGMDKLAQAVRMTLGPRGRAAVIEAGYGAPQVTFDGVTVAKEIDLQDKYENLGAEFLKQAAEKTNDTVGDGTTTAVVLAHAMIEKGEEAIRSQGFNVIQLAGELQEAGKEVLDMLQAQKELIDDPKKIEEFASLSSKSQGIGKLIADVMKEIGKDGVVSVEDSNTVGSTFDLVRGLQFDRGYISPYMVNNTEKMEAVLEDPYILVTDKKISSIQEMVPMLEAVAKSGRKDLLVVADDVEGEALATLIVNKLKGIFNGIAVKAPGFGDRKKEMLEDIAILSGAQVVTEEIGLKLDTVDITQLGSARRVVVTKDNTTIVDGKGTKEKVEERVRQLRNELERTESSFDKEKLQERLGKLSGGIAVIKVGAPTESAQKELKQRVEDAVAATRAAMEEGIVPGGGIALFNSSLQRAEPEKHEIKTATAARDIIQKALETPLTAIIQNSGKSVNEIMEDLRQQKRDGQNAWKGFNALTNEIVDLKETGIVDPLKVTKTAFLNAVSVASTYLTVGAAITEIPEKKSQAGGMPGMSEEY